MASRPELLGLMEELGLDHKNKSIDEMTQEIKDVADERFDRDYEVSWLVVSDDLRKFLTTEYDYAVRGKVKSIKRNYKGEKI